MIKHILIHATFCLATVGLLGCAPEAPRTATQQTTTSPSLAAQAAAEEVAAARANEGPRSVILFVGDGMGVSTITAARIFEGQARGETGEENELSFELFDHVALVKTYTTDAQVSDSAGTITALMTGQKTRNGVINVDASVERGDCMRTASQSLPNLLEMAEEAGYATGIVSTAKVTHATPAGGYAHVPDRNWEDNSTMPDSASECSDIARQLIEFPVGDGIDVVLGGGRQHFYDQSATDPEYPGERGTRTDGKDLIAQWLDGANGNNIQRQFVWRASDLTGINTNAQELQILGLFERSHMQFEADRMKDIGGEPSLAEMTELAIQRLRRNEKGFFLMVEAGRIDHAHHGSNAHRALLDTVALSDAVAKAVELMPQDNSLLVVTADHGHTLTISGYPRRGNPILGKVEFEDGKLLLDEEGRPYTTLSYANGPGYRESRPDLTSTDTTATDYQQEGTVPLPAETHSGEDVPAYAQGLNADQIRGVMEQNELFFVMRDALLPRE